MKSLLVKAAFILFVTVLFNSDPVNAQTKVMLDNYFNHEIHSKTGKPFHYLWSDKANSGFSEWGKIFESKGAVLDTLQSAPTRHNLQSAAVYIIVDPDTKAETEHPHFILKKDIKNILKWVKAGGVLVMMANDSGNCEFHHLNDLAKRFDMHFNEVRRSHVAGRNWNMGAITEMPDRAVFPGIHKIYMKDVSSLALSGDAQPLLTKNGNVFMAVKSVGKGHVLAVTDPWIYNEYIGHKYLPDSFENHKAAEKLTAYLLRLAE